ncbi:hypothetical protein [Pseudomonas sp.]|uniref:hypothetical protein n=1 Tax=Pseudomonas sp. TaxID=306 RepID=UPI003FD8D5DD
MMKETFADPIDRASAEQEALLQAQLKAARDTAARAPKLLYTGKCYNCQEPLDDPDRFCDKYCTEDYEKLQRAKSPAYRRLE